MLFLQMSACNCMANLHKNWQKEEKESQKTMCLYRVGSCVLKLKITQLVNSMNPAGKWWTGCFTVMCRAVHILSCLKYGQYYVVPKISISLTFWCAYLERWAINAVSTRMKLCENVLRVAEASVKHHLRLSFLEGLSDRAHVNRRHAREDESMPRARAHSPSCKQRSSIRTMEIHYLFFSQSILSIPTFFSLHDHNITGMSKPCQGP